MNGYEISDYKLRIMKHLVSDPEVAELLDPDKQDEYPDDMLYKKIFPYNRIHDTEQEVMTYICVMVDVPGSYAKNDVLRNVTIRVRIYAHEDLMYVKGKTGDRIDLIRAKIDELLNESFDFGIGYVTLNSNTEHVLDSRHFYREMLFKTVALNSRRDGVKQWSE